MIRVTGPIGPLDIPANTHGAAATDYAAAVHAAVPFTYDPRLPVVVEIEGSVWEVNINPEGGYIARHRGAAHAAP